MKPYSDAELLECFRGDGSTSKHLLTFYTLAIGLRAKIIVELGIGLSTGALRKAAQETGGTIYSYDHDRRRYAHLLDEQTENWRLELAPTSAVLQGAPEPIDLVVHDGAHDYTNVRHDLETLIPKMRRFGIICVHDTQQPDLWWDMTLAIGHATRGHAVSATTLPFNCGLTLLRVEESRHADVAVCGGALPSGAFDTAPKAFMPAIAATARPNLWTRFIQPHKIRLGHALRQAGLRR